MLKTLKVIYIDIKHLLGLFEKNYPLEFLRNGKCLQDMEEIKE